MSPKPQGYVFRADYDAENRLTQISYTDADDIFHQSVFSYSYNHFLARVQTFENQRLSADVRIVRNGFLPLQDRSGQNAVLRSYTWALNMGGGIGGLLAMVQNAHAYQYLYDGKGNVAAVLDADQQQVASYRYDALANCWPKAALWTSLFSSLPNAVFPDRG